MELHPLSSGRRAEQEPHCGAPWRLATVHQRRRKVAMPGQFYLDVIWFHVRCLACMVDCYTQLLLIQGSVLQSSLCPLSLSLSLSFPHVTQRWPFTPPLDMGLHHINWRENKRVAKSLFTSRLTDSKSNPCCLWKSVAQNQTLPVYRSERSIKNQLNNTSKNTWKWTSKQRLD